MKENSIEETIKQLELILKVRKEQKEIIECAGGSCINCDPDIRALTESIDILSDYKRVLKENERYRRSDYETICLENNDLRETVDRIQSEYNDLLKEHEKLKAKIDVCNWQEKSCKEIIQSKYISIQKVKDKIEKEIKYHERNILEIENITMLKSKTAKEEAEIEFNKYAIVVLKKILQELIEGEN